MEKMATLSNYADALSTEILRLRSVLKRIETDKGADAERLKRIAKEALEDGNA